ncbi:MAG: hypothetical protein ACK50A_08420 [Sphingobacteriaceae bacterium]|jgi:hypothetical protein
MQELNVTIFGCSLQEVITLEDVTGSLYQTEAASEKNAKLNFNKKNKRIK